MSVTTTAPRGLGRGSAATNPYITTTVRCAECGKAKEETNHWFVVWIGPGLFRAMRFTLRTKIDDRDRPVCGQACGQKLFEKWMGGAA